VRRRLLAVSLAALAIAMPATAASVAPDPLVGQEWWLADIGADRATPPGPGIPVIVVDSGGRVPAPLHPVGGRARIIDMVVCFLDAHPDAVAVECPVNGEPGIALHTGRDIVGVLTVGLRAERISRLWLVVNPDKLRAWNAH